jgi:hypothetical protein
LKNQELRQRSIDRIRSEAPTIGGLSFWAFDLPKVAESIVLIDSVVSEKGKHNGTRSVDRSEFVASGVAGGRREFTSARRVTGGSECSARPLESRAGEDG